jgi:hypothetical protein
VLELRSGAFRRSTNHTNRHTGNSFLSCASKIDRYQGTHKTPLGAKQQNFERTVDCHHSLPSHCLFRALSTSGVSLPTTDSVSKFGVALLSSMITPVHSKPALCFRPLRETPALCLTRNLSPDRQTANCLLLGCSDIGDILLTIFNNAQGIPS